MARQVERAKIPERRAPSREPRTRVLVLCCGPVSEREYFNGLRRYVRNPSVKVKVQVGKVADPAGLVQEAESKRDRDEFDEIWCVADVDAFDVMRAMRDADGHPFVRLALSNPCFELWLLLHFQDWRRHEDICDKLRDEVRKYIPSYDKHVEFEKFAPTLDDAVERATRLDGSGSPPPNPSTGVWKLAELVKAGGSESSS